MDQQETTGVVEPRLEGIKQRERADHIRSIHQWQYRRFAGTKRKSLPKSVLRVIDWYPTVPPRRMHIPNIIITGGDFMQRMMISYGFFAELMKQRQHRHIGVESARTVISDVKRRQSIERYQSPRYLFVHDAEQFDHATDAMNELIVERYQRGGATILVGNPIPVTDLVTPLIRQCVVTVKLGENVGDIEIKPNWGTLKKELQFEY